MQDRMPHNSKSRTAKEIAFKILRFPLTIIIVGCVVCAAVPLSANSLLRFILESLSFEKDTARMIRAGFFLFITLFTYYFLFKYYETRNIGELSLKHLPKEGSLGIVGAAIAISLIVFILYLTGCYEVLSINKSIFNLAYLLIIITSLAAFEEVIFRGVGYRIIEQKLGTNFALIITSLLFGLGHIPNENATVMSVIGAGIGGAFVGIMFSMTRRLWLPIFFHTGWNFAQACYGIILSGMKDFLTYSFFQGKLQGPDALTGGAFGLENSIITIAFTAIIFVVLYLWGRKVHLLIEPYWKEKSAVK